MKKIFLLLVLLTCVLHIHAEVKGSFNDNITWTLDDNGTLTMSGTGSIPNCVYNSFNPFANYKSQIVAVVIENGITRIGEYVFCECVNLTSVTIPNSVDQIGVSAFSRCNKLASVTIPKSVTSIGKDVFFKCPSLASIAVESGNPKYDSRDNCNAIIETATNTLISGCKNTIIPLSVTSIGKNAFYGSGLISIIIPESVTSIGELAFNSCTGLTSVVIPKSVTWIPAEAFYDCENLTSITNFSLTPQNIGINCFRGCTNCTLHVRPGSGDAYRNNGNWNQFTIVEDADYPLTVGDGSNLENDLDTKCTVTYIRNFSDTGWQELYVPFAMPYQEWSEDFDIARINDVHQYDTNDDGEIDITELEVIKIKSGSTEPNTPYLIRAKQAGDKTITLKMTTLCKTEERSYDVTSWNTKFTFTGNYHTVLGSEMVSKGYYVLGDGSLHQATDGSRNLTTMRWYLTITDRDGGNARPSNAREVTINCLNDGTINNGITAIESIGTDVKTESDVLYDMSGRKVSASNPKSGIYVENGRMVMIK